MEQLIAFTSNHPLLSGAWGGIVLLLIYTTIKIQLSPVKKISTQELTFLMNKEEGIVVDIRGEKEFKAGHILDAQHLSSEKANKNDFASLEKYKDKPIIVVCAAGLTAVKVANSLYKAGFTKTSLLKGGMNSWVSGGLPVSK
ncbi:MULTISPECIES: rhodanese-like domain-containing protein [Colwelliaceae]|uniref:rhodanese-like domain-containing protein n=1 Tax=Colwelliaceae TaxID=267889 RepID=UPI0009712D88|nr:MULTISPECIES: rhodanese-like domain-containing protein [Colwelliaceae]